MSISTSNLLFFLSQTSDLLSFFQKYEDELIKETPGGCLYALLDKYGLRPGDISARTGTGNYVYRILNDERTPGRDTVVAFCPLTRNWKTIFPRSWTHGSEGLRSSSWGR